MQLLPCAKAREGLVKLATECSQIVVNDEFVNSESLESLDSLAGAYSVLMVVLQQKLEAERVGAGL